MNTPNERLRQARIDAGYEHAVDAARALDMPESTYIGHENGNRGFPAKRAPAYARKFKVAEEWLLYGKTTGPKASQPVLLQVVFPNETVLTDMMRGMLVAAGAPPEIVDGLAQRLARRLPARLAEVQSTELAHHSAHENDLGATARSLAKSRRGSRPRQHKSQNTSDSQDRNPAAP